MCTWNRVLDGVRGCKGRDIGKIAGEGIRPSHGSVSVYGMGLNDEILVFKDPKQLGRVVSSC